MACLSGFKEADVLKDLGYSIMRDQYMVKLLNLDLFCDRELQFLIENCVGITVPSAWVYFSSI